MNQLIEFETENFDKLKTLLNNERPSKIVLFTGKTSYEKLKCRDSLESVVKSFESIRYCEITPNPLIEQIEAAAKYLDEQEASCIIAVGGGSVIDVAKSARHLSRNKKSILIAIPTTAGTGSESTQFATYYIGKQKNSFDEKSMLPNYVILSEKFTESLPKVVAAQTGVDALCQAIESYWNVNSTDESRSNALKAMTIINDNLEKAVNDSDSNSRRNMLIAFNLAGQAINITRTTASHSISYPITSFFGVPHGQAVSISLPDLLEYNYSLTSADCVDSRGSQFVKERLEEIIKALGCNDVIEAKEHLKNLFLKIGLEVKLSKFVTSKTGLDTIIENGFTPSRMKNNPRSIGKNELYEILEAIY